MAKHNTFNIIERYPANRDLVAETLNRIEALQLNFNPVHYSLMYECLANIDPYFSNRVEDALQANTYTDEMAEVLYIELISQFLNLQIPTAEVEELLLNLLREIEDWNTDSLQNRAIINDEVDFIVNQDLPDSILTRLRSTLLPTLQAFFSDTDRLQSSVIASAVEIQQLKNELEHANELARTDELTGIPNRRGFNKILEKTIKEAYQDENQFALIIFDLDFFKVINDTYGHLIGDSTLRYIAKLLAAETKGRDFIARIGGEEFAVILPNTSYDAALKVAENIRLEIALKKLSVKNHSKPLTLTVSGGVAIYHADETFDKLVQRADEALYHAKNNGRNRISGETVL